MNIEQKLALSHQNRKVCFIQDGGLFCRLYNQSAYIVTVLMNFELRLHVKSIKKLNNQKVITCGFPVQSIVKYFPEAKKIRWGYELKGDWDLEGYAAWQEELVAQAASESRHAGEDLTNNLHSMSLAISKLRIYLHGKKNNKINDKDIQFLKHLKDYLESLLQSFHQ